MSGERYSAQAMLLHWLHAALVISLLVIGLSMAEMVPGAPRSAAIALHKSLGLCALALVLVRLAWRRHRAPPPPPDGLRAWERRVSSAVHRVLYVLLVLTPVAGYLSASFTKYPMRFFGVPLPAFGWPDATLNAVFNALHMCCAWSLLALVVGHVLAALHHAWRGDCVITRMLPRRTRHADVP